MTFKVYWCRNMLILNEFQKRINTLWYVVCYARKLKMLKNNRCAIWPSYKIVILKFWELKNVKLSIPHLKDSNIFVKHTLTQQGFDLHNDMIYSMDWKGEAASHEALNVFSQVRFCAGAGAALWWSEQVEIRNAIHWNTRVAIRVY